MARQASELGESKEAIIRGTYETLCEHGYADLTMANIAAEAGVSKSLLHYHFDTKQQLLAAYLEYARGWHEDRIAEVKAENETALDQLDAILDSFLDEPEEGHTYNRGYLQLRVQAVHNEELRAHCKARRELIVEELATILAQGMQSGTIREDDPDRLARNLYTFMDGARIQQVVQGTDANPETVKQDAFDYLRSEPQTGESPHK
jgi:AcrR family transcriptional regulator